MPQTIIDPQRLTDAVADLVAIESINPALVPGGSGELKVARHVAEFLSYAGLEAEVVEAAPGRFNAVGVLRGRGGGRRLMLNGHLDTVGVDGMEGPFSARVEGGRLYGRGAQDMKGGVAAALVSRRSPRRARSMATSSSPPWPTKSTKARALARFFEAA